MLIAQLSDPHLTIGPLAAEPASGLYRALGRVLSLEPRPDCVVVTGDLTDGGKPAEYAAFRTIVGGFPLPVHVVPGNHDNRDALVAAFAGTGFLGGTDRTRYTVDYPEATIVGLDSLVPGEQGGLLGAEQLTWLDETLARRPEVPAFVCLHHPPVPVGITVMDGMRLADGDALAEVVARHRQVVRILTGHLHRVVSASFAGTTLTVAPSTYRQVSLDLRPGQPLGYVHEPTGFLLHLLTGSDCVTHTVAVSHSVAVHAAF